MSGASNRYNVHLPWVDNTIYWDMGDITGGTGRLGTAWSGTTNTPYQWHFRSENGVGQRIEMNATTIATDGNTSTFNGTGESLYVNHPINTGYNGDVAEIISYNRALNNAESTIVNNYLSAKYNLTISNDRYAGDNAGSDYDWNVAGIGQEANGSNISGNTTGGLIIDNNTFLQDNGDYLIAGQIETANATNVTTDLPSATANNRLSRVWYLDKTDIGTAGGTVNLSFDFGDTGLATTPISTVPYQLLYRNATTGTFTVLTTTTTISNTDQVVFNNINTNSLADGYYTTGEQNVAPTLDNSGTPTLIAIDEDIPTASNTGTLVSAIIASGAGGNPITDPNTGAVQGIAITGLNTANGTWQYTINSGTTWTNTPVVSATNALLLASNANTRIRFVPNATYNGTVANAITFAAWDQIVGINGNTANYTTDLATNTTSSVFSSAIETANITVNPAPTITSVTPVANGSYGIGQNLDFTVTFSQAVTITQGTGSAILPITLDTGGIVNATLVGTGASSTTQTFRYTVANGNLDTNGITVGTALTLSGSATIQNAAAANAVLTLNSVGATTGVLVDGVLPTVTSITSTTTDGTYSVGQIIPITVSFSEPVTVTGIPQLNLATGGAGTLINYASGTGSNTLTFNYTVAAGNTSPDLDYLSTAALVLNGGTIKDAATNDATLTLPAPAATNSLGANKAIVIDTVVPTVTSITSTTTDGTYSVGQIIPITVSFSESVTVTGIPQLTLATGGAGTLINYASGTGSNTLTFNYTVAAGNTTPDLDYLSTAALVLNGGTIRDTATNNAVLTLPTPAATNSLGANKAIVIDTVVPTVTINQATAQTDPTATSPINFTVTFSEPVTGFDAADINLTTSTASGTLTPTITGSGPIYTVAVNGMTGSGNVIASINANGVTDTAGNNNTVSTSTDNSVTYNAPVPEIQVLDGATDIVDGTLSAIDFGSVTVGATLTKTFTVNNLGTAALNLSNLTLPTGFSIVGTLPPTVAGGGSANVQVQVDTAIVGNKTGKLEFVNNDSDENPFDFPISASVTATAVPEIQVLDGATDIVDGTANTIDFGSVTVGAILNKTFTVKNLGTADLSLGKVTLPTGFSLVGTLPTTVAAKGSANLQVQVDTAIVGNKTGKLEFVNNDSDENPFDFPISASVTATAVPEIQVLDGATDIADGSTNNIDFGSVTVGAILNKTFTVKNLGTADLSLGKVTLPTGFSLVGTLPPTVAAKGSASLQVQVDTAIVGNKTGKLEFVNNDSDENPFDFPISASVTATAVPEI